jgi:hypothetical protein
LGVNLNLLSLWGKDKRQKWREQAEMADTAETGGNEQKWLASIGSFFYHIQDDSLAHVFEYGVHNEYFWSIKTLHVLSMHYTVLHTHFSTL